MTARAAVIGALTLAAALSAKAADAQSHPPAAQGAHTAKPAPDAGQAHAPVAAAKPPAAAAVPKREPGRGGDLKSVLERIDLQMKETPPTPPSAKRTAAPAAPPAPARVRLRWRLGLSWPTELDPPQAPPDGRISLSWR